MGEVSSSQQRSRAEIAEYLRAFADELDPENEGGENGGEKVTVIAGNESATINPPETVTFAVEIATDPSVLEGSASERTATFVLRWNAEDVEEDDGISVR